LFASSQLTKERCIDYPYLSWKLRSVSDDSALIDIQGKRQVLRFEIGPGYVILKQRNEPELAHLVNKKMTPGTLLSVIKIFFKI
jgi:cancer susceptibility candidate protein 1